MKILVGNNTLNTGGSETYTHAIIMELHRLGHDVEAIATMGGHVSRELEDAGITCHFKPIQGEYDLILLSHSTAINMVRDVKGIKIQTCQGIYPLLEQPVAGMDGYVSISLEVHNHLKSKGFNSEIIYNGIDCETFKPNRPPSKSLKKVLSLAHDDGANEVIREACNILGVELIEHNKMKKMSWDMDEVIKQADLIVSLGRGAYEAMAYGKNVVIFDMRRYMTNTPIGDGFLTKENVRMFMLNNCSGRYSKKFFNGALLAEELRKYNPKVGLKLRKFALDNFNIKHQVQKYLKFAETLI